jgi:DNA-binding FadR family transcriptional regulator
MRRDAPSTDPGTDAPGAVHVARVRKAHEQISDQLRELIATGELAPGQRLPNEAALAEQFGVSRATVREALRSLSSQSLIRTVKGQRGGSFVTVPSVDHIAEFLRSGVGLLSRSEGISLEEFLEAREVIEVPAARMAALRQNTDEIQRLRAMIAPDPLQIPTNSQFELNQDWHATLVRASGNALLTIAAHPVFSVLQLNLQRSRLGDGFRESVEHDHDEITRAIEAGDGDAAAEAMQKHLDYLRPMYEAAWGYANQR